ncbi:hypothetical protein KM043_006438 [Ampulex compressa]|nr:hypothetical protein KM043_006438 [Ampulex compressa]
MASPPIASCRQFPPSPVPRFAVGCDFSLSSSALSSPLHPRLFLPRCFAWKRHRRTDDTEVCTDPPPTGVDDLPVLAVRTAFAGINVHLPSATRLLATAERNDSSCLRVLDRWNGIREDVEDVGRPSGPKS